MSLSGTNPCNFSPSIRVLDYEDVCLEGIVNGKRSLEIFRFSALAAGLLLCAASAFAQGGAMSPYQGEQDGVSAGGKWMEFRSEDKMTGAKKSALRTSVGQLLSRRSRLQAQSRSFL